MLQFMGLQRVGHYGAIELNWSDLVLKMQLAFVLRILLKQIQFVSPINLIKLVLFSLFYRQDMLFLCGRDGKRVIQDSSFKRETAGLLTPGHFEAVDIINDYQVLCLVAQSCLTLCNPRDCSSPGSSVHGDSPGKNTGAGCMLSSRGSSQPRDRIQVSHIAGGFFTIWATKHTIQIGFFFFNATFLLPLELWTAPFVNNYNVTEQARHLLL